MREEPETNNWDFTPVVELIRRFTSQDALSLVDPAPAKPALGGVNGHSETRHSVDDESISLGNFDELWKFLGRPIDVSPPIINPGLGRLKTEGDEGEPLHFDDLPSLKEVKWSDEILTTIPGRSDRSKSQKRRLKRAKEREDNEKLVVSAAEPVTDNESGHISRKNRLSPASKAEVHCPEDSDQNGYCSWPPDQSQHDGDFLSPYYIPRQDIKKTCQLYTKANTTYMHIQHLVPMPAAERKAGLIMKLHEQFPEDKVSMMRQNYLLPYHLEPKTIGPDIHVFVDASNILIGFYNHLRTARGIPESQKLRRPVFSFHSLVLIMERGRRVSKRVLVGSSSEIVPEAIQCQYETNILEKVQKNRDATPRQKKYKQNGYGTSGPSSGSDTNGPSSWGTKPPWVEQAVDEILHLKILESLVDQQEPSTMVLATGDAAEAEFSDGFMRMVERALVKGWKVELVSFSGNISWAYRKKEFRNRWKGHFRIIELDDFSEELLAS